LQSPQHFGIFGIDNYTHVIPHRYATHTFTLAAGMYIARIQQEEQTYNGGKLIIAR